MTEDLKQKLLSYHKYLKANTTYNHSLHVNNCPVDSNAYYFYLGQYNAFRIAHLKLDSLLVDLGLIEKLFDDE